MRKAQQSAFTSPVLVGAVTVLVVLVAVFLAYNANQGLPFVPTRQLKVDIADASDLVVGNQVRQGGFRIGLLSDMRPIRFVGCTVGAQLTLDLTKKYGDVPADSGAAFDRPHSIRELPAGRQHRLVAVGVRAVPALGQDLLMFVDDLDRGRPLVRIHPDHHTAHPLHLLARTLWTIGEEGNATLSWAIPS